MDIALGIDVLPFKMTREMMCEVSFWAQNQTSYKAAEEIIYKVHGVLIRANTVRAIADYVGKIIFEQDTEEANAILFRPEIIGQYRLGKIVQMK